MPHKGHGYRVNALGPLANRMQAKEIAQENSFGIFLCANRRFQLLPSLIFNRQADPKSN
jgi:hypothetical protein